MFSRMIILPGPQLLSEQLGRGTASDEALSANTLYSADAVKTFLTPTSPVNSWANMVR